MNAPLRAPVAPVAPLAPPAPAADHGAASPAAHGGLGGLDFALPAPAELSRGRVVAAGAAILMVLGAAFLIRWLPMRHARQLLEADAKGTEVTTPRVQLIAPTVVSSDRALSLPGSVQALEETILYPRASGYVRKWHVDLGDRVAEGDLLAEIDTPEIDQQLAQARAQLAQAEAGIVQARANAHFSRDSLERYRQLLPAGLASQADFDKAKAQAEVDEASITVAQANAGAQQANIQMLSQLKQFGRVTAPFAGTVTSRTIERGTLVTAGNATPLFRVAATDPVRVFVQVPQDVAPSVRVGIAAGVTVREFPGRVFEGKVSRSAGALDPATRTMLTEVRVPNPKGEILAGMYAQVAISLPTPHRILSVPATALLNDAGGLRVALVDATAHVHLVPVVMERDTGPTVELSSGLAPEDQVVKLPSAALTEGRLVDVKR